MRTFMAAALAAGALFIGGGQAYGEPADRGNCVSTDDNGGAAGDRISSWAGPGFGGAVSDGLGGGTIGSRASSPDCRRP